MIKLLSIAGSDPSGGAGIQADIKTFTALGAYGMCIPTALTVQNTVEVKRFKPIEVDIIIESLEHLFSDIIPDGIKIGMVAESETALALARFLRNRNLTVVFDPVIKATVGNSLFKGDFEAFMELFKVCNIITPNVKELLFLTGCTNIEEAVSFLRRKGVESSIIVTGTDVSKKIVTDWIFDKDLAIKIQHDKINIGLTHGTGCTFSSALLFYTVKGLNILEAYKHAREFVKTGLQIAESVGKGTIPVNISGYVNRELQRIKVIQNLKDAFKIFSSYPFAWHLIPEVQSNLAEAIPHPLNIYDVAAFPGRIIKAGRSVLITQGPEFGASSHVARMIIAANKFDSRIRAAMNIKYNEEWIKKLVASGELEVESFSRKDEPEEIRLREGSTLDWGVTTVCHKKGKVPDIIFDTGDVGKEPMIRVFGRDAIDVVEKIRKIARILNFI